MNDTLDRTLIHTLKWVYLDCTKLVWIVIIVATLPFLLQVIYPNFTRFIDLR